MNPDPFDLSRRLLTRRRLFGLGAATLAGLLGRQALAGILQDGPPPGLHLPMRAKRVIYLHMEGAPSQLDLFDYKPNLRERFGEELPDSIRQGQRPDHDDLGPGEVPRGAVAVRIPEA
ncbi:MAG: DUF1501 domain-containing protein [Planctomycetota bacterium]